MVVPWRKGSHVWRKMLECRDHIEHQIGCHVRMGSSLFWFENWTGLGALYFITPLDFYCDESIQNIVDVVQAEGWDEVKLREILLNDLATHIMDNIKPPRVHNELDKPYWMLETNGMFSVKSVWDYLRKNEPYNAYQKIWIKGLPFKFLFFMWKV